MTTRKDRYFSDCGREDTQDIPYDELRLAFDCAYPGLSKPNTVWTLRMHTNRGKYEIAKEALARKKELFLHPPVGFVGCRGFEKFIQELPRWKSELTREDYDRQLYQMVQFLGAVPTVPTALRGINEPDSVAFGGGFDKAAAVLESLGKEYHDEAMTTAAAAFRCAVPAIGQIKETIVEYLTGRRDETKRLPALFSQAADSMRAGFEALTV